MNRSILVTGSSSGIGRAIADLMLEKGWQVFATARKPEVLDDLKLKGAHILSLDVNNIDSISEAVLYVENISGKLDVLVNNAGFGVYGPVEEIPDAAVRAEFDTNVFGLANVTRAFLPLLRKSKNGYLINISSIAGLISLPLGGWYCASKYAVEALSDALRIELKSFNIKVVLIEPGKIETNLANVGNDSINLLPKDTAYPELMEVMRTWSVRSEHRKSKKPYDVALLVNKIVNKKSPRTRYRVTALAKFLYRIHLLIPDKLFDIIVIKNFKA